MPIRLFPCLKHLDPFMAISSQNSARGSTDIEASELGVEGFVKGETEAHRLRSEANPFHQGLLSNLKAVLGNNILLWLVPTPYCECGKPVRASTEVALQSDPPSSAGVATAAASEASTGKPTCVCGVVATLNPQLYHPLLKTKSRTTYAVDPSTAVILLVLQFAAQKQALNAGRSLNVPFQRQMSAEEVQEALGAAERVSAALESGLRMHKGHDAPVAHTLLAPVEIMPHALISVDMEGVAICWDTANGTVLCRQAVHDKFVSTAKLLAIPIPCLSAPTGSKHVQLLTASWDGTVQVHSVLQGAEGAVCMQKGLQVSAAAAVVHASVSAEHMLLVAVTVFNNVLLWSLEVRELGH